MHLHHLNFDMQLGVGSKQQVHENGGSASSFARVPCSSYDQISNCGAAMLLSRNILQFIVKNL